jgi:hypothetical protein
MSKVKTLSWSSNKKKQQGLYPEDLKAHKGPKFADPTEGFNNDWLNKPFMEDDAPESAIDI